MSDYHILESPDIDRVRVVYHINVPSELNAANVDLSSALVQYLTQDGASITSACPDTNATELASLQGGTKYEHIETITFDGNLSDVDKRTEVENRYTFISTKGVAYLRKTLKFWGYSGDAS